MHLYKVCSKKGYLSLGTELMLSPRREERSVDESWVQLRCDFNTILDLVLIGAKLGANESGHCAACNQLSKQHWTHVFAWDRGRFKNLCAKMQTWA